MYFTNEGYRKFPTLTLSIGGNNVTFLADCGATTSVLTTTALPTLQRLSGRTCLTIGTSGHSVRDQYSVPLRCDFGDQMTKHSFIVSKKCPVNLMGRDVMCCFGIILYSTPNGVKVLRSGDPDHPFSSGVLTQMVKYSPLGLLCLWVAVAPKHTHTSLWWFDIICMHTQHSGRKLHETTRATLHCTCQQRIRQSLKRNGMRKVLKSERLTLTHIYWTKSVAAVAVTLSPAQSQVFQSMYPHVSLAKPASWK